MTRLETLTVAALSAATVAAVAATVVVTYPREVSAGCPAGTVATRSLDRGDMSRCVAASSPELAAATMSTESADTAREARRDALRWLASHPRFLALPSCAVEDASAGPIPCTWNVHAGDGNGRGAGYLVTGTHAAPVFHYVHPAGRIVWGGAR